MALIWEKNMETGHPLLDAQHREFLGAIDELREAGWKDSLDQVNKAFSFFAYYTTKHFFDEEGLQILYGYPEYAFHRACHDNFKQMLGAFSLELNEKKLAADLPGKTQFFATWMLNHILTMDIKLACHIKTKAAY